MEPDAPHTAPIYDLIYVDRQRASSYYAQLFGDDGTLRAITRTVETTDASGGGGKASVKLLALESSFQTKTGESKQEEYDPAWLIPLTVLDRLDEIDRLYRDLSAAPIGSLVLIKGALEVLDIRMLRELWEPIMAMYHAQQQTVSAAAAAAAPNRTQRDRIRQRDFKHAKALMDHVPTFLKGMPHAILATIRGEEARAWCTLPVGNLVVGTDDLALKHGNLVPGVWNLLGILDALPEEASETPAAQTVSTQDESMKMLLRNLVSLCRQFFGRPQGDYGVTPILLFREMAQRQQQLRMPDADS